MLSRRRLSLVAGLVGLALTIPQAALASTPITAFVLAGQPCVSGSGPANSNFHALLQTPSGHRRGEFFGTSDSTGAWGGCFAISAINGSDKLNITVGAHSRSIVIPHLEPQIDRVANTIQGDVAPNTPVLVGVTHHQSFKTSADYTFNPTSDGSGLYLVDTTGFFNLIGGDTVTVIVQQGDDLFGALALTPFVEIQHADNVVAGTVNPGTNIELVLTDSLSNPKSDTTAGPFLLGIWEVSMFQADGTASYPLGGDWLTASVASDATIQVPVSSLSSSAMNDTAAGRCMPNASYELDIRAHRFYGMTDSTGRFSRNLSSKMNIHRGDTLFFACLYATGDIWYRTGTAR